MGDATDFKERQMRINLGILYATLGLLLINFLTKWPPEGYEHVSMLSFLYDWRVAFAILGIGGVVSLFLIVGIVKQILELRSEVR